MNTTSAIWLTTTVLLTHPSGQAQPQSSQSRQPVASPETVRMERVTFPSSSETLVGDLYLPIKPGPYPALIISGAWRTVKEQMPAGYARQMAARGYAALVFDFRSWGQSTGRPRSMEDPMAKAQDIVAAARYLATRPDVLPGAIGGFGICASSAYMATAATQTPLIQSVALAAPALPSRSTVVAQLGGEKGVAALQTLAQQARLTYEQTGQEMLVPAVTTASQNTLAGADYYTNPKRGKIPQWNNTFNPASWNSWLDYDAQKAALQLRQPLLIVHSDAAASPQSVREFVAKVPGTVNQLWLDGVTQFDFYDQPGPMKTVSDAVANHFKATLAVTPK